MKGGGGSKMFVVIHAQGIKTVNAEGGRGSKNGIITSLKLFIDPILGRVGTVHLH